MKIFKDMIYSTKHIKMIILVLVLTFILAIVIWLLYVPKNNHITLHTNDKIDITPEQIQSIKAIGEWEFLAVADEELVDTVKKGLLKDQQLVRIYYGTVRLGINMHQVKPRWIKLLNDTVYVTLPDITVLDKDFIDEARTQAFYESGTWTAADREALFLRAHRKMLSHCVTPSNIKSARNNAELQFTRILNAMGHNNIRITFER